MQSYHQRKAAFRAVRCLFFCNTRESSENQSFCRQYSGKEPGMQGLECWPIPTLNSLQPAEHRRIFAILRILIFRKKMKR